MLDTDLTQREEICSFADIKKAIEIYAQFCIVLLGLSEYLFAVCLGHRSGTICRYL